MSCLAAPANPFRLPHRWCGLVRWTTLATAVPPLLFGPVHGLALIGLAVLAAVAIVWTLRNRRAAYRSGQLRRSAAPSVLDALTWLVASGVLLASLTTPQTPDAVGPGTVGLALVFTALTLLHRRVHPHR